MVLKFNLIVAVCENMGIAIDGKLPWKLKSEMAYFTKMTQTTKDPSKKNVVLMGRKTWDSIPPKFRPLPHRINMILTKNNDYQVDNKDVLVSNSLEAAMEVLAQPKYLDKIESFWIVGGSQIYKEAMQSKYFHRLYLTEIMAKFECDTFMPPLGDNIKLIQDTNVPTEIQEENGIKFVYKVYENINN